MAKPQTFHRRLSEFLRFALDRGETYRSLGAALEVSEKAVWTWANRPVAGRPRRRTAWQLLPLLVALDERLCHGRSRWRAGDLADFQEAVR